MSGAQTRLARSLDEVLGVLAALIEGVDQRLRPGGGHADAVCEVAVNDDAVLLDVDTPEALDAIL